MIVHVVFTASERRVCACCVSACVCGVARRGWKIEYMTEDDVEDNDRSEMLPCTAVCSVRWTAGEVRCPWGAL